MPAAVVDAVVGGVVAVVDVVADAVVVNAVVVNAVVVVVAAVSRREINRPIDNNNLFFDG